MQNLGATFPPVNFEICHQKCCAPSLGRHNLCQTSPCQTECTSPGFCSFLSISVVFLSTRRKWPGSPAEAKRRPHILHIYTHKHSTYTHTNTAHIQTNTAQHKRSTTQTNISKHSRARTSGDRTPRMPATLIVPLSTPGATCYLSTRNDGPCRRPAETKMQHS